MSDILLDNTAKPFVLVKQETQQQQVVQSKQINKCEFKISHKMMLFMLNQKIYKSKCCETISYEVMKQLDNGVPIDRLFKDQSQGNAVRTIFANYFKYMMKNPVDLQIAQLNQLYPWIDCIIQAKADGTRCLFVIYNNTVFLVFESYIEPVGITNIEGLSVFECELMINPNHARYILIYDQHMWQDKPIYAQKYYYRIRDLQNQIDHIYTNSKINKQLLNTIHAKPFVQIRQSFDQKQIHSTLTNIYKSHFEVDGLIFNTNSSLQYQQIYKWKPIEFITIDFLCVQKANTIYQLQAYDPELNKSVAFTSPIIDCSNLYRHNDSSCSLQQKIVEFQYDLDNNSWVFVKIRQDKQKNARGNGLKTARNLLSNIIYNISFDMLCVGVSNCYFEFKRADKYQQMTKFVNNIKQQQIKNIFNELCAQQIQIPIALDLGCGKGQDVLKFQDYSMLYCVDNDKYALWELNQRASALKTPLKVRSIQTDLSNWESLSLLPEGVDLLNCNLALHYFVDTLPYIIQHTKPKIINLMVLDGSKLQESNSIIEDGVEKYGYQRIPNQPDQIKIKLPFKDEYAQEQIILPEQIINRMRELNFNLTLYRSLIEYNNNVSHLTSADQQHISMYSVLQFNAIVES